jgi:hypothetical protein
VQLGERLLASGMPRETLRGVYEAAGEAMQSPGDKLRWAEGAVDLFNDREWAARAYAAIEAAMQTEADRTRFAASRRSRAGDSLYPHVPHRRHAA